MVRSVNCAFIVKGPVPVDVVSLTWRRWKTADEKLRWGRTSMGKWTLTMKLLWKCPGVGIKTQPYGGIRILIILGRF